MNISIMYQYSTPLSIPQLQQQEQQQQLQQIQPQQQQQHLSSSYNNNNKQYNSDYYYFYEQMRPQPFSPSSSIDSAHTFSTSPTGSFYSGSSPPPLVHTIGGRVKKKSTNNNNNNTITAANNALHNNTSTFSTNTSSSQQPKTAAATWNFTWLVFMNEKWVPFDIINQTKLEQTLTVGGTFVDISDSHFPDVKRVRVFPKSNYLSYLGVKFRLSRIMQPDAYLDHVSVAEAKKPSEQDLISNRLWEM